ncbi:App1 family protein [Salibacter sp.]|uniref:App1 family protein n=1 Tax=Salibacter sp. TaxID=2010995 RepID=UPI00286FFA47|nr:App1 family protein [Salibacter sp.]MDR9487051.1 App1 family protein [Salibacter sp.]
MNTILLHRGFGSKKKLFICGHAFRKYPVRRHDRKRSKLRNIINNIRRFAPTVYKNVEITVSVRSQNFTTKSDKSGYFELEIPIEHEREGWHYYSATFSGSDREFEGEYYIAKEDGVGVISDIDDSLLVSHSAYNLRKLYTLLVNNSHSRRAVSNIDELENIWELENQGNTPDFFIYLSNSEWNLYDFLIDFFDVNELPRGVYLLNSIITHFSEFFTKQGKKLHNNHKVKSIERLISYFPEKRWLLVGDTAQHDVNIFESVIIAHPNSIQAIIVREIKEKHERKTADIKKLSNEKNIRFYTY